MNNQVKIIYLTGKFHTNNLQQFPRNIDKLDSNIEIVLVDCKNLTFMDSSGLGALVLAFKKLQAANKRMILCSVREEVKMLFEITGMDTIFEIINDQEEFNQKLLNMN